MICEIPICPRYLFHKTRHSILHVVVVQYNNMLRQAISRTANRALISGRRSGLGALSAAPSSVSSILSQRRCFSSDLPDHTVQGMPALSPTMEVGNISWRMQVSGIPQYTRNGPNWVT